MSIVLITGSCGLVGSEAATFFSEKGFDIIGIDNNSRKLFFGKDGDVSWIRKKLERNIKNYKHFSLDVSNYFLGFIVDGPSTGPFLHLCIYTASDSFHHFQILTPVRPSRPDSPQDAPIPPGLTFLCLNSFIKYNTKN